jgi:hypothetical protein
MQYILNKCNNEEIEALKQNLKFTKCTFKHTTNAYSTSSTLSIPLHHSTRSFQFDRAFVLLLKKKIKIITNFNKYTL